MKVQIRNQFSYSYFRSYGEFAFLLGLTRFRTFRSKSDTSRNLKCNTNLFFEKEIALDKES